MWICDETSRGWRTLFCHLACRILELIIVIQYDDALWCEKSESWHFSFYILMHEYPRKIHIYFSVISDLLFLVMIISIDLSKTVILIWNMMKHLTAKVTIHLNGNLTKNFIIEDCNGEWQFFLFIIDRRLEAISYDCLW